MVTLSTVRSVYFPPLCTEHVRPEDLEEEAIHQEPKPRYDSVATTDVNQDKDPISVVVGEDDVKDVDPMIDVSPID